MQPSRLSTPRIKFASEDFFLSQRSLWLTEGAAGAASHGVGRAVIGIEPIVEINIYVTGLKPDDRSEWSAVGWKASVAFVDIVAIRNRGVDGSGTRRWNSCGTRFRIAPRALCDSSAIAAFASKLGFHKGSNRLLHGFVIRRAERAEQHLVVAFESERIRDHRIFDE